MHWMLSQTKQNRKQLVSTSYWQTLLGSATMLRIWFSQKPCTLIGKNDGFSFPFFFFFFFFFCLSACLILFISVCNNNSFPKESLRSVDRILSELFGERNSYVRERNKLKDQKVCVRYFAWITFPSFFSIFVRWKSQSNSPKLQKLSKNSLPKSTNLRKLWWQLGQEM